MGYVMSLGSSEFAVECRKVLAVWRQGLFFDCELFRLSGGSQAGYHRRLTRGSLPVKKIKSVVYRLPGLPMVFSGPSTHGVL
jgi:hypothetical protein